MSNPELEEFKKEVSSLLVSKKRKKEKKKKKETSTPTKNTYNQTIIEKQVIKLPSFLKKVLVLSLLLNIFLIPYAWQGFQFVGTTEFAVFKLRKQAQNMTSEEKSKYLELSKNYNKKTEGKLKK